MRFTDRERYFVASVDRLLYLKITGWSWFKFFAVLGNFSRYAIVWKLCTIMTAMQRIQPALVNGSCV